MDIIVLELILVAVVALGLGFWQLHDVNRELRNDCDKDCDNDPDNDRVEGTHATTDRSHDPAEDVDNAQDQ